MASVPKWLQTRLLTIVANVGVSISNLVFKYQHADVICSVGMDSLKYLSASALEWEPSFQQLEGPRKLIHKVCDIKGLTITLDRKRRTGSAEVRAACFVSTALLVAEMHGTFLCRCPSCHGLGFARARNCVWILQHHSTRPPKYPPCPQRSRLLHAIGMGLLVVQAVPKALTSSRHYRRCAVVARAHPVM